MVAVDRTDWMDLLGLSDGEVPRLLVLEPTWWRTRTAASRLGRFEAVRELGMPDLWLGWSGGAPVAFSTAYGASRVVEPLHALGSCGTPVVVQVGACSALQPTVRRFRVVAATCLIAVAGLTGCSTGSSDDVAGKPAARGSSAESDAFPVTVEHALGTTRITQEPSRVVTLGWSDQDVALALGGVDARIAAHAVRAEDGTTRIEASLTPVVPAALAQAAPALADLAALDAPLALTGTLELSPAQANAGESLVIAALASGDAERAKAALDRLRAQVGETEAVGNLTGMLRMAQLDPDGAREQFAAVAKAFPNSTAARMNLARLLAQQGRTAEAERTLTDMLAAEPANDQALSALVGLLLQDNRIGRAVAVVEAARTAAPTNIALTAVLADLYVRSGEAAKALTLLDGSIRGQTPPPALVGARARAQVATGAKAEAKETYRSILAANPGDFDARQRLVELHLEDKELDQARGVLRDGLRASPGNIGMLQALVSIEQRAGGLDAALAAADQLKRDPANMPAAAALRGDVYMSQRRFADAATAYAAEMKAAPSSALALRAAAALSASGAPDRAAEGLRAWLAQSPEDADAAQVLASLDIAAKRYPAAERALETVLAKRPNDAVALNNLAWVLQLRGDERARATAQRAYNLAPSPESADTLGWVMTARGDAGGAVGLLRQASQARPGNPTIQFHYAQALNATGQTEEAVKALTAVVNAPGEFEDKPAARTLLQQLSGRR